MQKMDKKTWIAVGVSVLVVVFFLFGGQIMNFFRSGTIDQTSPQVNSQAVQGLIVQDVVVGTGEEARPGNILTAHYTGALSDGVVFDSSVARGTPIQFVLGAGQVIAGWDQGLAGMRVGGRRILIIPPSLAYGDRAVGPIPPNSTLIFEVELLGVQGQ